MTSRTTHPDLETLSALADGDLDQSAAGTVERHVAECRDCQASLERVRALVASAGALPREVAPPPATWAGVRRGIAHSRDRRVTRRRWTGAVLAIAATLVLWVGVNMFPGGPVRAKGAKPGLTPAVPAVPAGPAVMGVERVYEPTVAELRAVFDARRDALAPATVRVLEQSLAVIDSAIVEARDALAADPRSNALVDLLAAHYARKVSFLKRAADLTSTM